MNPQEITDFFNKVMEQLGPTAQRTFQIVGQRVAAEATIWLAVSVIITIATLVTLGLTVRWYKKTTMRDSEFPAGFVVITAVVILLFSIGGIVSNAVVLCSLEYSTIERILNLVGGVRR